MRTLGLVMVAAFVLLVVIFKILPKWDISQAQSFCEALVPKLEEQRLRDGTYPKQLSAFLDSGQTPPKLARANGGQICGYVAAGIDAGARFSMSVPPADRFFCMYCWYEFESGTKRWRFRAD